MDPAYFTMAAFVGVGALFGFLRSRNGRRGRGGWIGLAVILALLAGLIISGTTGASSMTWVFGIALMFAIPIMFFLAIGSVIGSWFRRQKEGG